MLRDMFFFHNEKCWIFISLANNKMKNLWIYIRVWLATSISVVLSNTEPLCYVPRHGGLPRVQFLLYSCASCYAYLYQNTELTQNGLGLVPRNATLSTLSGPLYSNNETHVQAICSTINVEQCERWRECCSAAAACCKRQLNMTHDVEPGHCPRRWDGYTCYDDTPEYTDVYKPCPSFLDNSFDSRMSIKKCAANGSWYINEFDNEWTDYTPCVDKQSHIVAVFVCLACNIISFLFLVPASIIFLTFTALRKQKRIKLHIMFFVSLALTCVANILWYMLVHYDKLVNPDQSSAVMNTNPVWCRMISFFKLYFTSTNYFWMLCEGIYLHRLIAHAFEHPRSILPLCALGWAVPLLPNIIYAIIRVFEDNSQCWAHSIGYYQWILYIPNLVCLVVNLIFLSNILRILLFQMHSHPHEPSNFRKGLKAAFMLIPLFGVQMFLTIYRPPASASTFTVAYEYITHIVLNSQGVFVSLIFCFCNGEVHVQLRSVCPCCSGPRKIDDRWNTTQVTQMSTTECYNNDREMYHMSILKSAEETKWLKDEGMNGTKPSPYMSRRHDNGCNSAVTEPMLKQ